MTAPRESFSRLRLLWSFTAPHRRALVFGLTLALLGAAAGLATPMVTKWVLDTVAHRSPLITPIATLLGLFVISAITLCTQWIVLGTVGERVVFDARKAMIRRLFHASVPALTTRPTGELVTRVTSDTVLLHQAASSSLVGLTNSTVMLVGTLALMGTLDVPLFIVTAATVATVTVAFMTLMPGIARQQQNAQRHLGVVGAVLQSGLKAIRTVKASRAEERQSTHIVGAAQTSTRHAISAVRREAIAWITAWGGVQMAVMLVLSVGAWRVAQGSMEVSTLVAFLLYVSGLIGPITELSQNMTSLQSGIAAAGRIEEINRLDAEAARSNGRPRLTRVQAPPPALELRHVTAGYAVDAPRVQDINLTIGSRGYTAIVGPSGAGKTTVLSLIMRFLEPCQGELYLHGRPYTSQSHTDIRRRLAYVEQETPVVPGSIRDNLLYAHPQASDADLTTMLSEVGLIDELRDLEHGLDTDLMSSSVSSGQRQRIALARAMLGSSDVLLLDEATAQADGLTESVIHQCIRRRADRQAVIAVAHRLSTVIDADVIVVMQDGRIRAKGTHTELLATDSLYRDLIKSLRIADNSAHHWVKPRSGDDTST